jgi:multiple sugar transport system ATP-binding protein
MAGVTLQGVCKRYGGIAVIEDLDLQILDREFMVLVGPSGCGKSTVLRMIAGLEDVSGGTIAIGERVVNDLAPKDRDIAMVFQNYALYPHMTIRENLEFGLKMRRTPPAERERLVGEAAQILGVGDLLERRPSQLSGGQRQRVAVGRALVRKPSVFLFDEPLSNLDAKLRVQMRAEIKNLQRRLETTTVYVTHDQIEAMTMGSRIAVLRDGRIQQVGEPLEIYGRPRNLFVANFIGTPPMNLLKATLEGGRALADSGVTLPIPRALAGSGAPGRRIVLGIRPENVVDARDRSLEPTAPVALEVEFVEPLGDEIIVHGRLGREALVCKLAPDRVPLPGTRLDVAIQVEKMHVFDAETQLRMTA